MSLEETSAKRPFSLMIGTRRRKKRLESSLLVPLLSLFYEGRHRNTSSVSSTTAVGLCEDKANSSTGGDLSAWHASSFLILSLSSTPLLLFLGLGLWTGKRAMMGLGSTEKGGQGGKVAGVRKGFCGWEMTRVGLDCGNSGGDLLGYGFT